MAAIIAMRNVQVIKPKEYRLSGHLDGLSDKEMVSRYRFSNAGVNYLEDLLGEQLARPTKRGHAIPVRTHILMSLRILASGSFLEVIGDTFGYNKGTVSRVLNSFIDAVLDHTQDYINWPTNDVKSVVKSGFQELGGFQNFIGCIDGTHVSLQAPSVDEPSFVNRKGYHSINCQAVCDHKGKFTSFNASWPGSTHDAHVFKTSGLRRRLETTCKTLSDGIILGDSGYPCRPFIMTPFLLTNTQPRQRYQARHIGTRVKIERTFGRWKRRFHVLHSEVRMKPAKVCKIATVCAVLHNIAISLGEQDIDEVDDNVPHIHPTIEYGGEEDGQTRREYIVNNYFT